MTRRRRVRPYRVPASILIGIGGLLIVVSLVQLPFGVPLSEGVAPAGLSLGPLLAIGGTVLWFSQRPARGDRYLDDGIAINQMQDVLDATDRTD